MHSGSAQRQKLPAQVKAAGVMALLCSIAHGERRPAHLQHKVQQAAHGIIAFIHVLQQRPYLVEYLVEAGTDQSTVGSPAVKIVALES